MWGFDWSRIYSFIARQAPVFSVAHNERTRRIEYEPEKARRCKQVKLVSGSVLSIGAVTYGASVQDQVLKGTNKEVWAPQNSSWSLVQNAFSAKFVAIQAKWVRPDLTVKFDDMAGSRDAGEIDIATRAAGAEKRAEDAWRPANDEAGAKM
jgi:hypothetical protein